MKFNSYYSFNNIKYYQLTNSGNCFSGFPYMTISKGNCHISSDETHRLNLYEFNNIDFNMQLKLIELFKKYNFDSNKIEQFAKNKNISCTHKERWFRQGLDVKERIIN